MLVRITPLALALWLCFGIGIVSGKDAAKPTPHPWWTLTREEMARHFEEGRDLKRKGKNLHACWRVAPKPRGLGFRQPGYLETITVGAVYFCIPERQACYAGWQAEHRGDGEQKREATIDALTNSQITTHFFVSMYSDDDLHALKDATYLLETSEGQTQQPAKDMSVDIDVATSYRSAYFTCLATPRFSIWNEDGTPFLTSKTEWVRLWIIGRTKRLPVKYVLSDKYKAEIGREQD